MTWLAGSYQRLHRGADSGTSDPDGWELFAGGNYPTWRMLQKPYEVGEADILATRHYYKKVPALGRAASAPPEVKGVVSLDRAHSAALDGHRDSALASHPDGRFAQNTAATSDYSHGANSEIFTGPYQIGGRLRTALNSYTVDLQGTVSGGRVTRGKGDQGGVEGIIYPRDLRPIVHWTTTNRTKGHHLIAFHSSSSGWAFTRCFDGTFTRHTFVRSSHVSGSAIIATHPRLCCGILIFFLSLHYIWIRSQSTNRFRIRDTKHRQPHERGTTF